MHCGVDRKGYGSAMKFTYEQFENIVEELWPKPAAFGNKPAVKFTPNSASSNLPPSVVPRFTSLREDFPKRIF